MRRLHGPKNYGINLSTACLWMPTSWLLHSIETSFGSEKKKSVLKSKDLSLTSKLLMQTFTLGFQDPRAAAIWQQEKTNGESFVAKAERWHVLHVTAVISLISWMNNHWSPIKPSPRECQTNLQSFELLKHFLVIASDFDPFFNSIKDS